MGKSKTQIYGNHGCCNDPKKMSNHVQALNHGFWRYFATGKKNVLDKKRLFRTLGRVMGTLTLQLPRGLAAFYGKKAKDRKVSVAALFRADLLRMNEFEEDGEYDGELEKEANSPEMEKLRAEYGVLTREAADWLSEEMRNGIQRPSHSALVINSM
jgi:hypothetical protein